MFEPTIKLLIFLLFIVLLHIGFVCPMDVSWVERDGDSVKMVCGDEDGNPL